MSLHLVIHCYLWTCFKHFCTISVVDFERVNVSWVGLFVEWLHISSYNRGQASKMNLIAKIVSGCMPLTIFPENSIIDNWLWQGSEYSFVDIISTYMSWSTSAINKIRFVPENNRSKFTDSVKKTYFGLHSIFVFTSFDIYVDILTWQRVVQKQFAQAVFAWKLQYQRESKKRSKHIPVFKAFT